MASKLKEMGHRLKQYMQHRGLTINKLAKQTNLSAKKLNRIIDGKHSQAKNLLLVLDLLTDLNQVWLMTGAGDMLKNGKSAKKEEPTARMVSQDMNKNAPQEKIVELLEQLTTTQEKILKQNKQITGLLQDAVKPKTEKTTKKKRSKT